MICEMWSQADYNYKIRKNNFLFIGLQSDKGEETHKFWQGL